MYKENLVYVLLQVWIDGSVKVASCYKKKSVAEKRRDAIAKVCTMSKWVITEAPLIESPI